MAGRKASLVAVVRRALQAVSGPRGAIFGLVPCVLPAFGLDGRRGVKRQYGVHYRDRHEPSGGGGGQGECMTERIGLISEGASRDAEAGGDGNQVVPVVLREPEGEAFGVHGAS